MPGLSAGLAGQDRIITLRNDTIVCKITKITRNEIQFDIVSQGVAQAGRLPLSEICSYSVSTLPMWEPGLAYPPAGTTPAGSLRIGFNGGMGYLTSSSESAEETMAGVGIEEEMPRTIMITSNQAGMAALTLHGSSTRDTVSGSSIQILQYQCRN